MSGKQKSLQGVQSNKLQKNTNLTPISRNRPYSDFTVKKSNVKQSIVSKLNRVKMSQVNLLNSFTTEGPKRWHFNEKMEILIIHKSPSPMKFLYIDRQEVV